MLDKHNRVIFALLLVILCVAALGGNAFALGNAPEETEPAVVFPEDAPGLTPDGNMAVIDDLIDYPEDEMTAARQFLTLKTRSGNVFYVIVDRTADGETVHFLNQVDEADLLALVEEDALIPAPICSCKDKCMIGAIDTSCEICRVNLSECAGAEPPQEKPAEPEKEPVFDPPAEKEKYPVSTILLGILTLITGYTVYLLHFRKPKADPTREPDDNDFPWEDEDED